MKRHLYCSLSTSLLASSAVVAQTGGASLAGHVTDASGGALPGVTVTAPHNATGFTRSVVTGTDGNRTDSRRFRSARTTSTRISPASHRSRRENVELNVAHRS